MLVIPLFVLFAGVSCSSNFFESFTGNVLTLEQYKDHIKKNTSFWCTNEIINCDPHEGRRVDGSCYNPRAPSVGATHTPLLRVLPAAYDTDYEPRKSVSGEQLPLTRSVRTGLLTEGRAPDALYTHLLTHFWVFISSDVVSLHDTVNYVLWKPHCCTDKGKTDKYCIPTEIPDRDPVHRFTNIRCMNLTRPESFQSIGCIKNNTAPERIVSATPHFDLSQVYGSSTFVLNEKGRLFKGGLLKVEEENGKIWPPTLKSPANVCVMNQPPNETRCHDAPEISINSVLGINLFAIWSWRLHNRIATILATINPCWDDNELFFTAREITIAMVSQIHYYELLPALLGRDNLIRAGIISPLPLYRDVYNENILPQISLEFPYVMRWSHTIQEGILKLYDSKGNQVNTARVTELTLRTGYLVENLEFLTQGAFRQATGKPDYNVDNYMAEIGLGNLQASSDILNNDLKKGRYFGFPPYVKYRELCSGKKYRSFDDLLDVIDPERIELLKEKYKNVDDIDLLAGIWMERHIRDGRVPVTMYCLMIEQMARSLSSDPHWYERPNRPNAFSLEQLLEIRKTTVAKFLCVVGDTVTEIQPNAFYMAGPGNDINACKNLVDIDLWAWRDIACHASPFGPFKL